MSYTGLPPRCAQPVFDPNQTVLAGMTRDQMALALASAQSAMVQLQTGGKVVTATYAQGDGSKSVTYNMASIAQLAQWITLLQRALGIGGQSRRPLRMVYT